MGLAGFVELAAEPVRTGQPTLAQVFGWTGQRDLAKALTIPATKVKILVPAAIDAADWMTGIIDKMLQFAPSDPAARETATVATGWQHDLYEAAGDSTAATHAIEMLETLQA